MENSYLGALGMFGEKQGTAAVSSSQGFSQIDALRRANTAQVREHFEKLLFFHS